MKSIEERAYDIYTLEPCPRDCEHCEERQDCLDVDYVQTYIKGSYDEREELLKWNDKNVIPEEGRWILEKIMDKNTGKLEFYFPVKYYSGLFDYMLDRHELFGWRYIEEL